MIEQQKNLEPLRRVLVIEDDPGTRESIALSFEISTPGVVVSQHDRSNGVVDDVIDSEPDIATIDLGLPDGDGLTLIRSIREVSEVPIIVISARDDDSSIVAAISLGADGFLVKPISLIALQAHVDAVMRMKNQRQRFSRSDRWIELPGCKIDLDKATVEVDGVEETLSKIELNLIRILYSALGRIVPTERIKSEVWGQADVADATVKMAVHRTRQKLGDEDGTNPKIVNHRSIGYSLTLN